MLFDDEERVQFESDDLHRETVRLLSSTARPVHDGMEDHLLLQLSKQEMNTTTKVMNPKAITSIYGEFPSLVGTELTEVRVARDEPRISIRLAMGKNQQSTLRGGRRITMRFISEFRLLG
jgi:hypothetical protein